MFDYTFAMLCVFVALCQPACDHHIQIRADEFVQVTADLPAGLSDLTVDERDHLWAIAEREPVVAEITLSDQPLAAAVVRHPLDGVPPGVDTEAIAYLGNGRFAIGTEGHATASAGVLFGQLGTDGHISVAPGLSLTSESIGVELRKNEGVEALCGSSARLVVGIETAGTLPNGTRYAPVVRVDGKSQVVQRLMLTTTRGKLSALSCSVGASGTIKLLAIERDHGVTRILEAKSHRDQLEIRPHLVVDLWPLIHQRFDERLNLEGIARLRDGRIVLINDNQGPGLAGPTWLFIYRVR